MTSGEILTTSVDTATPGICWTPTTPEQWEQLHTSDKLDEQSLPDVKPVNGVARLDLELPMPGVIRLRLRLYR